MQLLKVRDLAQKLNVPESWIRRRLLKKLIPFLKVGRHIRFDSRAVDHWILIGCPEKNTLSANVPERSSYGT